MNVEPLPNPALAAVILPLWSCTIVRAMPAAGYAYASPKPNPPAERVVEASR